MAHELDVAAARHSRSPLAVPTSTPPSEPTRSPASSDVLGVVGTRRTGAKRGILRTDRCAHRRVRGHLETAGALRGGRETFVTMRLPESMIFDGKDGSRDRTDFYLAALNSHDGYLPQSEMRRASGRIPDRQRVGSRRRRR